MFYQWFPADQHAFKFIFLNCVYLGYKKSHSKDYKDHMKVMAKSVSALAKVEGTKFTYGPISEVSMFIIFIKKKM